MTYELRVAEALQALGYEVRHFYEYTGRERGQMDRSAQAVRFRQRMAVELRDRWGMSYPEIAEALRLGSHVTAIGLVIAGRSATTGAQ